LRRHQIPFTQPPAEMGHEIHVLRRSPGRIGPSDQVLAKTRRVGRKWASHPRLCWCLHDRFLPLPEPSLHRESLRQPARIMPSPLAASARLTSNDSVRAPPTRHNHALGITTVRPNSVELWNRMSSGSYLPGPVRAVEIPKNHGAGIRVLGVPNVADRIAQTAAAMLLEEKLEPIFHPDSYGYRPGRSAPDALGTTRKRCWRQAWVVDLDIRAFFDSIPHDLLLKAVAHHTNERWVLLYIARWLTAPMQMPDGTLVAREKGTPQGS